MAGSAAISDAAGVAAISSVAGGGRVTSDFTSVLHFGFTSDLAASAGCDAAMAAAWPEPACRSFAICAPAPRLLPRLFLQAFSESLSPWPPEFPSGLAERRDWGWRPFWCSTSWFAAFVFNALVFNVLAFDAAMPARGAVRAIGAGCLATRGRAACSTRSISTSAGTTT